MGFYSRFIFPRLCDWVMGDPRMGKLRSEVLAEVGGEVLEIGFGTGLNLAHYPEHVRRITTVDPNPGMNKLARRRIDDSGIEVDQRASGGEQLPFGDGAFDLRGEHLDAVQHPRHRAGARRGLPGAAARRPVRLPGARPER